MDFDGNFADILLWTLWFFLFFAFIWVLFAVFGFGLAMLASSVSAQTLTIGVRGGPDSIDPHFTATGTHAESLKHVFDTLVWSGDGLELEPRLAERDYGTVEAGKRAALIAVDAPAACPDIEAYLLGGIGRPQVRWVRA